MAKQETKTPQEVVVEESVEDLIKHIRALEYQLMEAKTTIGDLVIRNNRQEQMLNQLQAQEQNNAS